MAIENDVAACQTSIAALQIAMASAFSGLIASHTLGLASCYSSLAGKLATASDATTHGVLDAVLWDLSHHTATASE